jgi:hypothetical protein
MSSRYDPARLERRAHQELARRTSDALAALNGVEHAAWMWADGVRACVEERGGMSFEDARVLDDLDYVAALDLCGALDKAKTAVEQALRRLESAPAIDMTASPVTQQAQTEAER